MMMHPYEAGTQTLATMFNPLSRRKDRVYDLDLKEQRRLLGLKDYLPRADRVIHLVGCDHVVIEEKGKAQPIKHAIEQLQSTLEQLTLTNLKYAVIVKEKIPRAEAGLYRWDHRGHLLLSAFPSGKPITVGDGLPVMIFTPQEAQFFGWM